ncbi:MAG: hypothetical protein KGI94_00345 [Paracoccaceae bacterium]|nr:hypothetical protein [Paracoccaceae bacterium]
MARDFEHVVMTRFNLATPGREHVLRNRAGWLEERFDLFERYCLPSIAAQSVTDFHWIIYFDEATPDAFRQRIERCRKVAPFVPYYTGPLETFDLPRTLHETFGFRPDHLLTTRLDNDDALAIDYVARVQAEVRRQGLRLGGYNVLNGFILAHGALYQIAHRSNAFFSFLAPYEENVTTAASIKHMELAKHAPVIQIDGPGGWLQVVHGGNVSNKIRGTRVSPEAAAGRFPEGLTAGLKPIGPLLRAFENAVPGAIRGARDAALALRRRLRG